MAGPRGVPEAHRRDVPAYSAGQARCRQSGSPAAGFSPPQALPRNKGQRGLDVLTAGGEVWLNRIYFWRPSVGGYCPADAVLGVDRSDVTPGARQLCCLMGVGQDFDQASRDLKRVGGLSVGKERLRLLVEGEGRRAREQRDSGQVPALWSADEAKLPDGRTRVFGGVDGVMTPAVTQQEKDKRRQNHITRRQQRGKAGLGNTKDLPPAKPGSDEKYKEVKIGLLYDQDKTRRHVFATESTSKDIGPLLAAYAKQIGFERADQTICLIDGAVWIYQQVCLVLLCLQAVMLDFYHLAEHVHATARCCLGEGDEARQWAHERLSEAKRSDVDGMLAAVEALGKKVGSAAKKKSVKGLCHYISERREMLDYGKALAEGWDIGSGPTEATCKTLTLRIKCPGMKWERNNAVAVMNLVAMRGSGQWETYWEQAKMAA